MKPRADWLHRTLDQGAVLSHCPRLSLQEVNDSKGRRWLLLGEAVQTAKDRPSPEKDLQQSNENNITTTYETWSGRWVLIGDGKVHSDAGALLGCYYRRAGGSFGDETLWVSSSLALLYDLPGLERCDGSPRKLLIGDGFEWDPPPGTAYRGIHKLLPSQILVLETGAVEPRRQPVNLDQAYDRILDRLADHLVTAMTNLQGDVNIALTAGYDSRVLLAAAHAAGIPFRCYTQSYPDMTTADRQVPTALAAALGVHHELIEPTGEDPSLLVAFDEHCAMQNADADRAFYGRGQWSWTKPNDVLVRGMGFEVGHCFYWNMLPAARPQPDELLALFGAERSPAYVRDSVASYLRWVERNPDEGIDWRDRFYLEVRLGGWASAEEQSLDLVEGTRAIPANAASVYALLLAVPPERRRSKQHHVDLVERLAPELLRFPFNQSDSFVKTNRRRMVKFSRLLKERGVLTTTYQVCVSLRRRMARHRAE